MSKASDLAKEEKAQAKQDAKDQAEAAAEVPAEPEKPQGAGTGPGGSAP